VTNTGCDEQLAIGQQRGRVIIACSGETAGGRSGASRCRTRGAAKLSI
jgi:hypothetical protein